jgi:hypothetical protein
MVTSAPALVVIAGEALIKVAVAVPEQPDAKVTVTV